MHIPIVSKPTSANKVTIETINFLASTYQANKYLEIGVKAGGVFFHIDMERKVGVDPVFQFEECVFSDERRVFFRELSDAFFERLKRDSAVLPVAFHDLGGKPTFDIIFIDGMHTFEQCFRDFQNSLAFAHDSTIWVLDDTVPSDPFSSLPNYEFSIACRQAAGIADKPWHGDVFKIVFAIHDFYPDFSYCTRMAGNPQTVVWRATNGKRKQLFTSIEQISCLDYFKMLEYAPLLMPVNDDIFRYFIGMSIDPIKYGTKNTWKKLIYRCCITENEKKYNKLLKDLSINK